MKYEKNKKQKNKFKFFLRNHGFLPLNHWKYFELEHGKKDIFKDNLINTRKGVGKKSGIYIYKKGKRILYIGKAVSLFSRIKSHNRESFECVPGDRRDNGFHKFFSTKRNCGKLRVYWKEIKIEEERIIFEAMLQYFLDPEFK
ncbi:MAG: hypothetical protein PHW43_11495 [Syntrophales bacterium]|nr:hypothetical protein [Syntrophales bacterium]